MSSRQVDRDEKKVKALKDTLSGSRKAKRAERRRESEKMAMSRFLKQ
jgi:hypothetical protein